MTLTEVPRLFTHKHAILLSIVCAVVCLALAVSLVREESPPELRMSAGPEATRRHVLAQYFAEQAAEHHVAIKLLPNAGSEECLQQLKAQQLDAAIVCNGMLVPDDNDIMVVGAVQSEALHILVRKDVANAGPLGQTIRGKRVNVGERGSTEWFLARDFLNFARLTLCTDSTPGNVYPMEYTKHELTQMSKEILHATGATKAKLLQDLPDVVVLLESMPSPLVQLLVEAADYQLLPLPATRAFLLDNMQDSHAKVTLMHRQFLESTSILSHSYAQNGGIPKTDTETLGVRLLVVARRGLADSTVKHLTKAIFEGEFASRIRPQSPRDISTPYAIHPGAVAYFDRDKPLAVRKLIEWVSKGLSYAGAFSAGALSLYSLLKRRKTRKPSDYYAEIRNIEAASLASAALAMPGQLPPRSQELHERLLKLRNDLIEDLCEGSLKGDQAISNIIAMLGEARSSLAAQEAAAGETNKNALGLYQPRQSAA
jgi:TRAP-type uncharacterized transport system substrate-binding protein